MNSKSIRQQFADTVLALGQEDPSLVVLIGDISHFALQPFAKACPGRFYNVGICEPTIVSMGAGLAKVGLCPVMHTIAPFLIERSFEQIKLDFCYQRLGGNIVTVGSAFDYSNLGCTHHCYGDFALLKTLEGAEIVYPATAAEFDILFRQAYHDGNLTVFRIPEHSHSQDIPRDEIQFGRAIRVVAGSDLTIIATGPQLSSAVGAQKLLRENGWDPEILYVHTIRPLDVALIAESLAKTHRVVVVEEHMQSGGLNEDVLRIASEVGKVEFLSLAIPNRFIREYGTYEHHCQTLGLTPTGVAGAVCRSLTLCKDHSGRVPHHV